MHIRLKTRIAELQRKDLLEDTDKYYRNYAESVKSPRTLKIYNFALRSSRTIKDRQYGKIIGPSFWNYQFWLLLEQFFDYYNGNHSGLGQDCSH